MIKAMLVSLVLVGLLMLTMADDQYLSSQDVLADNSIQTRKKLDCVITSDNECLKTPTPGKCYV